MRLSQVAQAHYDVSSQDERLSGEPKSDSGVDVEGVLFQIHG